MGDFGWIQLPLIDEYPPALRSTRRRGSAHNAKKRPQGRTVVAGGWVVDEQDRVLLLHRCTPSLTQWETPGGKVERGETPAEAAIRELWEELGVSAVVIDDLGWHDFESGSHRLRYALFKMRIASGRPRAVESQRFDGLDFFQIPTLYSMRSELSPNALNLLSLYYRGVLELSSKADTGF